jgi:urease accessory protein
MNTTVHAAALLLLGDGRFPAGGYAHSGGLEPTIQMALVHDLASLESFLEGRARSAGLVAATFAAPSCVAFRVADWDRVGLLDAELDARTPSPALRATSRQLGRQLLRVVGAVRPHPGLDRLAPLSHQPVVLGAAAAIFGLGPQEAALLALHESVAGPAAAAVRLLSLDPFATHACLARLGPLLDELAEAAAGYIDAELDDLPAASTPLLDLAAEHHTTANTRLFAS